MERVLLVLIAAAVLVGCDNRVYVGDDGFFTFALTEDTPPIAEVEDNALYLVEQRVELPILGPSDEQANALDDISGVTIPYDRLPWVRRTDYEIEIDWVLVHLDDATVELDLVLNGINEFHEYNPEFVIDDEEIFADFAGWERRIELGPFERAFGTIREEEIDEVAVDLATVVNGVSNPNQTVHPNNHSSTDVRSQDFIPDVIPALTGVRVGIRSTAAANVVIEYTVRVRERRDVIVHPTRAMDLPVPELFGPGDVRAAEEAAMMMMMTP